MEGEKSKMLRSIIDAYARGDIGVVAARTALHDLKESLRSPGEGEVTPQMREWGDEDATNEHRRRVERFSKLLVELDEVRMDAVMRLMEESGAFGDGWLRTDGSIKRGP